MNLSENLRELHSACGGRRRFYGFLRVILRLVRARAVIAHADVCGDGGGGVG